MIENTQDTDTAIVPLVAWKNPPSVRDLKQDLEYAKPIHDAQVQKIQGWLDNLNVEGKAKVDAPKGNSKIVPKLIRKQAEWRYAALSEPFLSTADVFNVKPVSWEDRKAASQNQLVLNHQFNTRINKQRFIDEYVRAAVDEGTVAVKVGWVTEEEEYEEEVPDVEFRINPEFAPMHQHLAQLRQESPSQWQTDVPAELKEAHELTIEHGQPVEPVIIGKKMETKTRLVKNHPTVEVLSYKNVVLDPTAQGDVEKAQFAVISFETCLADLKKDKRYKNLDKINLGANNLLSQPDNESSAGASGFNFSDKPRKKFWVQEYWGFWDIEGDGKTVPIVATWVGDTLIRMELNPFPDKGIPLVIEQYLPVRKSNYGEPDGALLEDNQKVIGAVTRGMIDIMGKSANGQTGMRKDMLDATNRRKYERGLDYEFNPNVDPRVGVHMHTYPEIPQSAQFMLQLQNMDAESLTGVKSFSQGISGQALGEVAVGVRGALDAASKRELGILRRLASGVVRIGRKFIAMNAEFLSEEEVVRVSNEEFVAVRRDDLPGKFDLELSISTAEEDNAKAQDLGFVLQTVGPQEDPGVRRMILADLCRLKKLPDLAKKIESYEPQPDPLQQRIRELEIEKLEAEIANLYAQGNQRNAAANLSETKRGTETVKAENLQSKTDQQNLDFVEQESGVKQARELEKSGQQASAQVQLKLLDNGIQREKQEKDLLKEYLKQRTKKAA
jgi:hypothetical protein